MVFQKLFLSVVIHIDMETHHTAFRDNFAFVTEHAIILFVCLLIYITFMTQSTCDFSNEISVPIKRGEFL